MKMRFFRLIITFIVAVLAVCPILLSCSDQSSVEAIRMTRGVANINEDLEVQNRKWWSYWPVSEEDIDRTVGYLKEITVKAVDETDRVTDVEYYKIEIELQNGDVETVWLLYDYYLEEEYLLYDNVLYKLTDYSALKYYCLLGAMYFGGDQYYYRNATTTDMSFRYYQHWTCCTDDSFWFIFRHDIPETEAKVELNSRDDAVAYLRTLLSLDTGETLCFYDETTDYYYVQFYNPDGFKTMGGKELKDDDPDIYITFEDIHVIVEHNGKIVDLYTSGLPIYVNKGLK